MLRNSIYYRLKPVLPRALRLFLRRRFASQLREQVHSLWPIMPGSERPPDGWGGWPENRKFALVLTHDVEGRSGLSKCRTLMERERALGFRSSFNFVPEGKYEVTSDLRQELVANGFEVGIHDLKHDGRLFDSSAGFTRRAQRINHYVREWKAAGFRSGFMLQNLDWLHQLDIAYDASTFDTDPFEPQPEGRHTIFPFWIDRPDDAGSNGSSGTHGYAELPYTLPQDSTLFLVLREQTNEIWKRKADWIASHGGMILLNTHPDYMSMNGRGAGGRMFPVEWYEDFLKYIQANYAGQYWNALPREVASMVRMRETERHAPQSEVRMPSRHGMKRKPKIWIDLDNTPHVPFFEPIMEELEARGYPLLVTARDAFQVCDLASKKGIGHFKIGRHHGKNRIRKVTGLMHRALQLAPLILRERPLLGVSHGSRSQLMLGNWLRMPTMLLEDYEYCSFPFMMKPSWIMAPEVIPKELLPARPDRLRQYPGIKEDVYAWRLTPDAGLLSDLGLDGDEIVVTVRPPATEAHYHNPESELLFTAFMDRACSADGVRVVLLPRNQRQREALEARKPEWFRGNRTIVPSGAVDGMNLLWHSDLVVSGGGTMNREAAALGVPVFSIFRGTLGAVDRQLNAENRLGLITSADDVARIPIVRRPRRAPSETTSKRSLLSIVDAIVEIAALCQRSRNGDA